MKTQEAFPDKERREIDALNLQGPSELLPNIKHGCETSWGEIALFAFILFCILCGLLTGQQGPGYMYLFE